MPLDGFTLAGPCARRFRHALRRADDRGLTLAVNEVTAVPDAIDELRTVSDPWFADKMREKRFSPARAGMARAPIDVSRLVSP